MHLTDLGQECADRLFIQSLNALSKLEAGSTKFFANIVRTKTTKSRLNQIPASGTMYKHSVDGKLHCGEQHAGSVATFGPFELQLDTGELSKHGQRVRLQRAPFHILSALIEHHGRVVTREELRAKVWPSNTFVDFESGLNTAMNRLRTTLGDSAESPIYVETLARVGYRFIAPVAVQAVEPAISSLATTSPQSANGGDARRQTGTEVASSSGGALDAATVLREFLKNNVAEPSRGGRGRMLWVGLAIAAAAVAVLLWLKTFSPAPVVFRQLTFSRETVYNARFVSDGTRVIYDAAVNGRFSRLFITNTGNAPPGQTRDLGYEKVMLASVSRMGDIAMFARVKCSDEATLEQISIKGGTPRILSSQAREMDWSPSGTLGLLTHDGGKYSVEFPPGHKLYSSSFWMNDLRVSPHGDKVAFLEHPIPGDDAGRVMVVDSKGKPRILSDGWESIAGLAWQPRGDEVWFTAARSGVDRTLMAVDQNGRTRQVSQIPGGMLLRDISPSGDVLIAHASSHLMMVRGDLNTTSRRDISWLDWSRSTAISPDGNLVLFDESGQGGGRRYTVYLFRVDAGSAERIGEGRSLDLSGDGMWALTQDASDLSQVSLVSIASHKVTRVSTHGLEYRWAKFLPGEGEQILFNGNYPGKSPQLYRQQLPNGAPVPVSPSMSLNRGIVDDTGHFAAGISDSSAIWILDLRKGTARSIANPKHVEPVAFAGNNRLLTSRRVDNSLVFEYLDTMAGALSPLRIEPFDGTGVAEILPVQLAKDLHTFVYSRLQTLSTLYVVSGWS